MNLSKDSMETSGRNGWKTVCGGILLHIVIGTMYNWGNIITYVTSYLRFYNSTTKYAETMKIYPIALATHGFTLLFSGWISDRIGYRNCCILGSVIFISGTFLASVSTSYEELMLTQGFMFGLGMGLTYTVPIASAVRWLPHRQGIVSGLIVAGFGCGPFVFGPLSSYFANPRHLSVENDGPDSSYFPADSEVIENVPYMFRNLALIYTMVMFIGCALIVEPPAASTKVIPYALSTKESAVSTPKQSGPYNRLPNETYEAPNIDILQDVAIETDLGPLDMARLPLGWHLALCLALTGVGGLYLTVSFKVFAQQYFTSDLFLTTLSSTASLFNAFGRILWGYISDRHGPLPTLIGMSALFAIIIWFYPTTARLGPGVFSLWTFMVFFFEGSNFVLYIPLCIQCFGRKNATSNYALLFLVVPIFNLINIFLLADLGIAFETAASILAVLAFCGCVVLILLAIHMLKLKKPIR